MSPKIEAFQKYAVEYDQWFEVNPYAFQSELLAIKNLLPHTKNVVEIGIGSGMFAVPLGIREGIDPSDVMLKKAKDRGLKVQKGIAEKLPYPNSSLSGIIMITTICFVDDIYLTFEEAFRVLKPNGFILLGFVDKNSPIGQEYLQFKEENVFYKDACFYSTEEVYEIVHQSGFMVTETNQTVFGKIHEIKEIQPAIKGFGKGSFVVIKAKKINKKD